jgi:catechol 2,3-dioxygenase-like lactoylglutathione lyase family enzyme
MQITSVIAQLRTTDLNESIRFYTEKIGLALEFQYEDVTLEMRGIRLVRDVHATPWGTKELVIKDNQSHTLYFGQSQ